MLPTVYFLKLVQSKSMLSQKAKVKCNKKPNKKQICSMDFGCVTPEYVYRMWGGTVKLEEIEGAMAEIKT